MIPFLSASAEALAAENVNNEGYVFGTLFFSLFVAFILDELFGQRLLAKLRAEDSLRGKVILRRFGKLWLWGNQLFWMAFLACSVYVHSSSLATIFFVVSFFHGVHMINILSTRVEITDTSISCKTVFNSRKIDLHEICEARWISQGRSFGYFLVLNLRSRRRMEFSQIYFIGLNDLWERFNKTAPQSPPKERESS